MNSEQTGSKAGGQGGGARAITRADDYQVRAAAERCFGGHTSALAWSPDGKRLLAIEVCMGAGRSRPMRAEEQEQLATEGIVPGPEGWCWAAPAGVEGQDKGAAPEESEPAPSPPPQPEGRPARLRAALLAVLTPGPVHTTAVLLPALDAAMGEERGVAVARSSEAMKAAREVGARVDGVEWSLPAVPDGWGWRLDNELGISFLLRESVPTSDINTLVDQAIARADEDTGEWMIWLPGADAWTTGGNMLPLESAQAAALAAARLAGLFAAPRAEAATGAAPAPKAPAHASDAPCPACARAAALCEERNPLLARLTRDAPDPIDAGRTVATWVYAGPWRLDEETSVEPATAPLGALARILTGEAAPTMADATAALAAFRADVVATARAGVGDDAAADARHAQRIAENERDAALARAGLDAADRATLDAVGRLREALAALCAGPGQWRWAVDESAPDAAVRLMGEMVARLDAMRGETWKDAMLRANKAERDAQAERDLTAYHRKRGDEAERERDEARALHRDQSHKAADAERALGFARRDLDVARGALAAAQRERDATLAESAASREALDREVEAWRKAETRARDAEGRLAAVGAMLDPVLAAIAGGRAVAK